MTAHLHVVPPPCGLLPEPQRRLAKDLLRATIDLHQALAPILSEHPAASWAQLTLRLFMDVVADIHNGVIDHETLVRFTPELQAQANEYAQRVGGGR